MKHSFYDMEKRMTTLHQTVDYDRDNTMKDINGKGWIDLSILDAKLKLNLSNLDSGFILTGPLWAL